MSYRDLLRGCRHEPAGLRRSLAGAWRVRPLARQARADHALELSAGLAHELNNTLAVVVANIELAQPYAREAQAEASLLRALQAAERGCELGALVMAANPGNAPHTVPATDLDALIGQLERAASSNPGPFAAVTAGRRPAITAPALVLGEADLIETLLGGVIRELRDRLPEGGQITIAVGAFSARHIDADVVVESSIGTQLLPPSQKAPARLRRAAIAGLIRMLGASQQELAGVSAEGAVQLTVTLSLPRAGASRAQTVSTGKLAMQGDGQLVLAVDTDPGGLQRLHLMIEGLGYSALSASDDREAIDIIGSGEPVAAILCRGGHALAITRWLKRQNKTTPVVSLDADEARKPTRETIAALVAQALGGVGSEA